MKALMRAKGTTDITIHSISVVLIDVTPSFRASSKYPETVPKMQARKKQKTRPKTDRAADWNTSNGPLGGVIMMTVQVKRESDAPSPPRWLP